MSYLLNPHKSTRINAATDEDWRLFLDWAEAEGWIISALEHKLFAGRWQPFFQVLRQDERPCAFVSAVIYPHSAWIGNLIVDPQQRKCGFGTTLLDAVLTHLEAAQTARIWLTASAQGEPLYRKRGFTMVDICERWIGTGLGGDCTATAAAEEIQTCVSADTRAWGESRQELIEAAGNISPASISPAYAALIQPGPDHWHVGPWIGREDGLLCSEATADFVSQLRHAAPGGRSLAVDMLKHGGQALALQHHLHQSGFRYAGSNTLMCKAKTTVNLNKVFALASPGSIG